MENQSKIVNIIVDYREKNSGVIEELRREEMVSITVDTLTLGDYFVDERLLFERKTLPDFITSIKDGRLFHQAIKLASSELRSVIILEGTSSDISRSSMRREAMQGALITLTLILGIPILRSLNAAESAQLILYSARQVKSIASKPLPRRGARPKGKKAVQLNIMEGLPGIGPKRALSLLNKFGSIEAVLTADLEELRAIEGIGKRLAESIRRYVTEPETPYKTENEMMFSL